MPLKTGPKHLEENFHELRHGPQFAETKKEHGAATARSQMIAIALKEARKRSKGGKVHIGPIRGDEGGRTDIHEMKVPDGAYVLSADVVSHLGENNTEAGLKRAHEYFGDGGKFDQDNPDEDEKRASGGKAQSQGNPVDCITAGGEYVISPRMAKKFGHGDMAYGHKLLDQISMHIRKDHISTLKNLPPPAQD